MALFKGSAIVGQLSGKIGGSVFSKNKGGAYIRSWARPTVSVTSEALRAKGIFALVSATWALLTQNQREGWRQWAANNPITNRLGSKVTVGGNAAFVGINCRLAQAGDETISEAPTGGAPAGLTSLTATFDIGAGTTALTFEATPLGADDRLWIEAAVWSDVGRENVSNLRRLCGVSDKAQATGYDWHTVVESEFGTLAVGQRVRLWVSVFSSATGLLSGSQMVEGTIVETT